MKTRLKIDLTIDEDVNISGDVLMSGDKAFITAALLKLSGENKDFNEIIQKVAEVKRIIDENASQNN